MSIEKKLKSLAQTISEWIHPLGYKVLYAELQTHQGVILRIIIDWETKDQPITIENIMQVHQKINPKDADLDMLDQLVDQLNLIQTPYHLEISSPGLQRRLQTPEDFLRFSGKRIKVITLEPLLIQEKKNCRTFLGILQETTPEGFYIEKEEKTKSIPKKRIYIPWTQLSRANLEPEFTFTGEQSCQN